VNPPEPRSRARRRKTVVEFYVERTSPSLLERTLRRLASFEAVDTVPGADTVVETVIPWCRFAHENDEWAIEEDDFRVTAALSVGSAGPGIDVSVDATWPKGVTKTLDPVRSALSLA
jgi:Fibronectin type III-like domain